MFSRFKNAWYVLTGNLWFKPLSFSLLIFVLIAAVSLVDYHFKIQDTPLGFLYNAKLAVAQDIAVSLMTAMISMTTLVISITMIVLSLASSQMGPRLIQTFISDRRTQSYIGLFFGSVVVSFYLVRVTHSQYFTDDLLPVLTITLTVLYCFSTLFILLFFINHVAVSCMADTLINKVSEDLLGDIRRVYKSKFHLGSASAHARKLEKPKKFKKELFTLRASEEGYIQNISTESLLGKLEDHDAFAQLYALAGAHVLKGQVIGRVYRERGILENKEEERFRSKLEALFVIGSQRTRSQDIGYSLRNMVEMALRALSPGINDPFTAYKVIDKLAQGLVDLTQYCPQPRFIEGEDGVPRMIANAATMSDFTHMAFDQIREAAASRLDVNLHLLRVMEDMAPQLDRGDSAQKELSDMLLFQVESIGEIEKNLATSEQKKSLRAQIDVTTKALKTGS